MSGISFHSSTDFITISLTLFSSLLALLMFFKYLIMPNKTRGEIILCVFIFLVSIWRFSDGLEYSELYGVGIHPPVVFVIMTSISYFFTGPLLFFYVRFYISSREEAVSGMLGHLVIPCLLSVILIAAAVISLYGDFREPYIEYINSIAVSAATALLCAYVLYLLVRIIILLRVGSVLGKNILAVIGIIAILIIGAGLAYLLENKLLLAVLALAALIIHFMFFDAISASLQIVQDQAEKAHYRKTQIRDVNVDEIIERIEVMMSWEKIYRDDRLSLNTFAEHLGITPHQLSEILNTRIGLGFYPFINNYRINEAREILERDKTSPVIKIAYQVGFNSLSSFYTTFKKITGMSPGSYQKYGKKLISSL